MKVVFYNHTGKVSGAERMLLTVLTRLNAAEFERVVLCPNDGPLAGLVTDTGARVEMVNDLAARFTVRPDKLLAYAVSSCRVIADLRRKFVSLKPDLIHANSIRAGLMATIATAGLKTRVAWHLHDLLPGHPLSSGIRLLAALSKRSRMIAVSEAVGRNFCGKLSPLKQRVEVILNAIDLESFAPSGLDREAIRTALAINKDDFVIGIVGQLTPRKGQLELLTAFAEFFKTNPRALLVIVGTAIFDGDQAYEELLRRQVAQLGIANRVMMLGNRNDVRDVMRAFDALVVNSRREPFGLVACEAMACGTPVIATASDGLPEIVTHQKNGLLVTFGNQAELVQAMTVLSENSELRMRLVANAARNVAERFAFERYLNELETFYHQSCDEIFVAKGIVPASGQTQTSSFSEYYHERI